MNNKRRNKKRSLIQVLLATGLAVVGTGCGSIGKSAPHSQLGMVANLERDDIEIIRTVEGESTKKSFLFGSIQVIDGEKYKLLWIPFFQDKGAGALQGSPGLLGAILKPFTPVSVIDRAYYDALAETPDADTVFYKTSTQERRGIPLLCTTESVTLRGKAAKIKAN